LKLARQYHISNDQPSRTVFLSRTDSYHGNTLGALSAGFNRPRRRHFEPLCSPAFQHIDRCFYIKDAQGSETESQYLDRLLASYESRIHEFGPSNVAALMLEPVAGATLGCVTPVEDYLTRVRRLCDKYGVLLIYDEVMCGMGRCGTYHAWESFGGTSAAPDIQAIGKGLAAGYQPLSSVLIAPKVFKALSEDKQNSFINGHTYQGHALACATALAVQKTIFEENLLANVRRQGAILKSRLREELNRESVMDIRGCGLFVTVEFRGAGPPIATKVRDLCFERGLAVYLVSGGPDAILFAPPFIISDQDLASLVKIFASCVNEVEGTSQHL
jgi:adenosylmethionine-8-amino-7-oxononanoate aminotransferase